VSAPTGRCPRCNAELAPGQDWCTSCGYAATTRVLRPGNWRVPIMILAAIFLLALGGVAAAFVAVSGDTSQVKTITNPPKTLPATGTATAPKPSTASTPTASTPTGTTTSTPTTTHACGTLGITPDTEKEGTCVQGQGANKHSVTLVNGDSTLTLQELDVKVTKVSTPSSVSGSAGTVKPVAGKTKSGKSIPKAFVVLEITWKNNDKQSRQLNSSGKQLALQSAAGGGQVFPPGEKAVPGSTFNAKSVEPGKKGKVEAIFQVPEKAAEAIKLRGAHPQLAVWEFSTAGQKKEPPSGFVRLWNV